MHQKLKHPIYSYSLVSGQFGLIGALAVFAFPANWPIWSLFFYAAGTLLGLWALKTMHLGHFNIVPDPLPHLAVVTTGPYRFIRHPMYAAILLFCLPLPLLDGQLTSAWLYFALFATLLLKLHYEETLICRQVSDYRIYQTHTKKLLPWVF
ncbi:isoprenylcysteine carboxyl methyltransferase [Thiosulfatimonas sediminis]|uniref:Isoprenylcysteine carboxyl methyltransferase n=1 Tax=Thiosulfatimonas sediminis TaxID=2675054 RepID=A0A6F8PTY2_9GAMM|nr:methyltransferase [Thiosulfatimonas sediminis]BBP45474.1 isoprenylcysteine carboxyl methyltransferase [Thiosulfatimonas sediminis]